jgi:hypothetical protein
MAQVSGLPCRAYTIDIVASELPFAFPRFFAYDDTSLAQSLATPNRRISRRSAKDDPIPFFKKMVAVAILPRAGESSQPRRLGMRSAYALEADAAAQASSSIATATPTSNGWRSIRRPRTLYLSEKGAWQAKYIPAFVRRYPFVFSSSDDGKNFTLCIDERFAGCNREGRGQPLFASDGKPSAYTENVLKFLQEYQAQFQRTQVFCRKLSEHKLLEPMQAQVTTQKGDKLSLSGFKAINRDRLKKLAPDALAQLASTDELELVYLHRNRCVTSTSCASGSHRQRQSLRSIVGRLQSRDAIRRAPYCDDCRGAAPSPPRRCRFPWNDRRPFGESLTSTASSRLSQLLIPFD